MTDNVTNAVGSTVAERLAGIVTALTGLRPEDLPVRMRTWDGGVTGPADPDGTLPVLVVNSPTALTRLLWSPGNWAWPRPTSPGRSTLKRVRAPVTATHSPRDSPGWQRWRGAPESG